MASPPPPPPSSASHRRRSRPSSPAASSVASSPAFPPRKKRRSGRRPPLLGLACSGGFYSAWDDPRRPPSANKRYPFAQRGLALARKADFDYHFLKEAWSWFPLDARDGRVLIQTKFRLTKYAVCDPLFKRYVLLPPLPDRLTVSQNQGRLVNFGFCLAPFQEDEVDTSLCLAPSQEYEVDTSFRVICVAAYETKLVVFVFSSVTRQWGVATSSNWTSLGTQEPPNSDVLQRFDYVDGCFYWTVPSADKILVLDALKMEFSFINYAHRAEYGSRACIAVDRKGAPGMLTVGEYLGNRQFRLSRIAKQSDHGSRIERLLENIIQLPDDHNEYFTLGAAEGLIFLRGIPEDDQDEEEDYYEEDDHFRCSYWEPQAVDYYSLNVKTAEFVKVCDMYPQKCYGRVCPYFRFPPPSAKPCV